MNANKSFATSQLTRHAFAAHLRLAGIVGGAAAMLALAGCGGIGKPSPEASAENMQKAVDECAEDGQRPATCEKVRKVLAKSCAMPAFEKDMSASCVAAKNVVNAEITKQAYGGLDPRVATASPTIHSADMPAPQAGGGLLPTPAAPIQQQPLQQPIQQPVQQPIQQQPLQQPVVAGGAQRHVMSFAQTEDRNPKSAPMCVNMDFIVNAPGKNAQQTESVARGFAMNHRASWKAPPGRHLSVTNDKPCNVAFPAKSVAACSFAPQPVTYSDGSSGTMTRVVYVNDGNPASLTKSASDCAAQRGQWSNL